MKNLVMILFCAFLITVSAQQRRAIRNGDVSVLSNTVIVKMKSQFSKSGASINLPNNISPKLKSFGTLSINQIFTSAKTSGSGLDNIYSIEYTNDISPYIAAGKLSELSNVEWAEPRFLYSTEIIPNDLYYSAQTNLTQIKADAGWNVTTGDTNVIIGIDDTGFQWNHPDLFPNVWHNWKEIPGNGIDDDGNGYVDDYVGWDFGGSNGVADSNPIEDNPDHGSHVAGIASAATNNSIGVAGVGFNTHIMAIKTARNDVRSSTGQALIAYGYEGIIYGVKNGCKVINCSWGGSGYSIFGQQVIDYAVAHGVLVVCAAGNSNTEAEFFPAGYKGVLCVAAVNGSDVRSSYSNYGYRVDVAAPGDNINSTWMTDAYTTMSGTSMASPTVSGLAGLVVARFPNYSALQIAEQIRVTADNINSLNSSYVDKLGKGRINVYNALTNTGGQSIRLSSSVFSDADYGNGDGIFQKGETISLKVRFKNILNPISSASVSLVSLDTSAVIVNSLYTASSLKTGDSCENFSAPFQINVSKYAPLNQVIKLLLRYTLDSYSDYQSVSFIVNPSYATQSGNDVALTITSKGTIGYNDYPTDKQGAGFIYQNGTNMLFEGALMMGTSATKISDAARNASQGSAQDARFTSLIPFTIKVPGAVADYQGYAKFSDDAAGTNKLNITTELNSYSYNSAGDMGYIILHYKFKNTGAIAITNYYAGLFTDWDMVDGSGANDIAEYDTIGALGHIYHPVSTEMPTHAAIAEVSSAKQGFWAIMNDGTDGGFQIYDGFSDAEKWQSLSSGIGKPRAGTSDISCVTSSGPYTIEAGQSIDVAFALTAGASIEELRNSIASARSKFNSIVSDVNSHDYAVINKQFVLEQNYPNPFNPSTVIKFSLPVKCQVRLDVFNSLGETVKSIDSRVFNSGNNEIVFDGSKLSSGIYFYSLTAIYIDNGEVNRSVKKMILLK